MSASESRSAVVMALAEEFLDRYRQGHRPSLKEYIDRHPELAAEIKDVFPAMALMENIALADESLAGAATGPETVGGAVPPEQLGDYRILREVGRGGMGIVYEAEQVSLGRHVALKVLPRKVLLDAAQKRRFEREAKAAAKLHHTNIVPVFGVGEHDGLPYYVMQFIQGLGLDAVLAELKHMQGSGTPTATGGELRVSRKDVSVADVARSLLTGAFPQGEPAALAAGLETRHPAADAAGSPESGGKLSDSFTLSSSSVKLPASPIKGKKASYWQSVAHIGVQVADALEYAHKQGIQHRDIKPANLLLDTAGTVWVTDFGLARAESEDHLTATGDIVGTLRYMPPEAFEGRTDKRGDIYSLGLTLYELLARQPAFAEHERHRLIKRVTTEEPARLDKLNRDIPRDLVTVVHKAIDREPARRYATAGELSADLQRYLDDEPIRARPISNSERLLRWCRRNPGVASLTATLTVILLAVTVVSLVAAARFEQAAQSEKQARREAVQAKDHEAGLREQAEKATKQAESNLREAERHKQRAEANFAKAQKAVDAYFTTVSESQLLQVPGMQPLRRDLLQSALTFYQDFLKERGDDPALRGELAAAYLRVGKIHSELGKRAETRKAYQQAQALYEALTKAAPESVEWRHGLAQCYLRLGRYDEAIALWQKLVQPDQPRFQKELADAYNGRAIKHGDANRLAEALQDYQQSLAIREMLVRLNPDDLDAQRDLGGTLNNIGVLLIRKGRPAEALAMYRRAVEHSDVAFAQAPQNLTNGRFLTIGQTNIAGIERQLGNKEEALAAYRRAVEVWRRMARDNPAVPSLHSGLFGAYRNLAQYQRELKQTEQAERSLRLAREVIDRLPSDGPADLFCLACVRVKCSTSLDRGKEKPTAEEQAERERELDLAMEALHKAIDAGYRNLNQLRRDTDLDALRGREDFKALEADLAARVAAAPADKLKANQQALAHRQKAAQADPKNKRLRADLAASQHAIALIQFDLGKLDEAQKYLQQAITLREALINDEPKNARYQTELVLSRFALGDFSWRSGRLAEAAKTWQQQLVILEKAVRPGRARSSLLGQLLAMRRTIGQHYARAGLWSEAADNHGRLISLEGTIPEDYFEAACLAARAGDAAAYQRVGEALDKRLGDEQPHFVDWACWAYALRDGRGTQRAQLLKKIQNRKDWDKDDSSATWKRPLLRHIVGLAHYRAGRFAEAIAAASKAIASHNEYRRQNLALLALSHHRLGHAAEARQWLEQAKQEWRQSSPLLNSPDGLAGLTAVQGPWRDWMEFEILFHEASLALDGHPPVEEAYDHAHRSLLYSRLGESDKAETEWQAAVKMAPREPMLWLVRGRAFAQLGQHDKADVDFAKAATLTPEELDRFPQAGWWVVGPYPKDLKLPCPPEKDPDPSRPVAAARGTKQLHWQPASTDLHGRVNLQPLFNAVNSSVYALTYVYSPTERTATLLVGGDDLVRVWLNGRPVHETGRSIWAPWDLDRVPVTLKAGRNVLLAKVFNYTGPHFLYLRLADNPLDRAWIHARLGLWDEAAAESARGLDRQPSTQETFYRVFTHAQLVAGDTAAYRRYLDRMFQRYDKDNKDRAHSFDLAYAGGLLEGAAKAERLVELAEHALGIEKAAGHFHAAGIAHYRAGQFEQAIGRLQESLKDPGWQSWQGGHASELGLALAHHRLGHAQEARQWLDKAEQWYDKAIQGALTSPAATANLLHWADWPSFVVLRREAHKLILGKDLPDDPRLKKLAERTRDRLKKYDKATADYDVAIFFSPNEPRLRLSRARRLIELKRAKEAEADLAKAALKSNDPEMWKERSQLYFALGQKDKAAADLVYCSFLYSQRGDREKAETEWQAAVKIAPREPAVWLARGRLFAQRGQHDKADAAFAKAAALTPNELNKFIEAGWWVVGPYPEDLKQPCPPEKNPDPSRPVAAIGKAEPLHWKPLSTEGWYGSVQLRTVLKADNISAYALNYVYSPEERTATLLVGGDDRVRVWLNGRLVHETNRLMNWPLDLDRVPVTLKAGRNILLCKVSQDKDRHLLILRIADNPFDRAIDRAQLGLWDEAAALFARGLDQRPEVEPPHLYRFCAHANLLVGDTKSYRRYLARMFDRFGQGDQPINPFELAYAGCLLDSTIEPKRLVQLAELAQQGNNSWWGARAAGIAHYRAGQFEQAVARFEESLKTGPAWLKSGHNNTVGLGLALAHHRLGHAREARQWLDKAEEWYEKGIQDALASSTGRATLLGWAEWPGFVVLRREAHKLILGKDLPDDPRLKKLADRMRDRLKKLDPATADYDAALILYPGQARLWQARGRRLTELKRDKEAEADFAKAKALVEGQRAESKK